jgi:hypothetical protein
MRATRANKPRLGARRGEKKHAGAHAGMRRGRAARSGLPWLVAAGLSGAALLSWIGLAARR